MYYRVALILFTAFQLFFPPCCGQLRPDLQIKLCPAGREYNRCGCTVTCSNYLDYLDLGGCKQCTPGCYCPDGYVEYNGQCTDPEQCAEQSTRRPTPRYTPTPPPEDYKVYPYPSTYYPYDPFEPYDPYDPYPFQYCELNEDEYGRP